MCKQLIDEVDHKTVRNFIQTNKRVESICGKDYREFLEKKLKKLKKLKKNLDEEGVPEHRETLLKLGHQERKPK